MAITSNLYTTFDFTNNQDGIFNSKETVSIAAWSDNNTELTNFYYYDNKPNRDYFVDVYYTNPNVDDNAEIQFGVAYGNYYGCGNPKIDTTFTTDYTASKIIYSNIKSTIGQDTNDKIIFDSIEYTEIYALTIRQERLHDRIKYGSLFLHLNDGSYIDIYLADNSSLLVDPTSTNVLDVIVANSDGTLITPVNIIGKLFIEKGLIILNVGLIETYINDEFVSFKGLNSNCDVISNPDVNDDGYSDTNVNITFIDMIKKFDLICEQNISSIIYFVRVSHTNYNHSNNPTYISNTVGDLLYSSMVNNPFTYITSIGLYNNNNELLAISRLSKPILKNYENEILIRVKLTF